MNRKAILLFAFTLVTQLLWSQNYMNLLNLRYYYLPSSQINSTHEELSFSEFRIETILPYQMKNGNVIGIKPQYKSFSLAGDTSSLKDLKLHSIKMPLFVIYKFKNPKWSMYFDISPKLNSDFENVSGTHFQIGGTALGYYEQKDKFFWQFGVYYNQDTYGAFIMPLLGLDWKIDEKNYLALLLPCYAIFEHKLSKKLYSGIELELTGETYRMGGSVYKNSFYSQLGEDKMTFLTEPRLFIDYYLTKHIVLYVKPGMRLFQKYEHFTEDDKLISNSDFIQGQLKDAFYIEFGLAMRYRYDEESKKE
jgi:hypothetical protein